MGFISWITAILALIIAIIALVMQLTTSNQIDFQQCKIVYSESANTQPQKTTCNTLCSNQNKKCVFGLSKFSQSNNMGTYTDFSSQESLTSCDSEFGYGTVQDNNGNSYVTGCLCCN